MKIGLSLGRMKLPRFCFAACLVIFFTKVFIFGEKGQNLLPKALIEYNFTWETKFISILEYFGKYPGNIFLSLIRMDALFWFS